VPKARPKSDPDAKPRFFHHPDFCPTVIRRRLGLELLEIDSLTVEVLATRGRPLTWNHSFPTRSAN